MLSTKVVSLSLAITGGVIFIICAVLVSIFPVGAIKVFNTWMHGLDLTPIISTKPISVTDIVIGLVSIMIVSAVVGVIFTAIYNSLQRKGG